MTRSEFITAKKDSEQRITRRVFPFGVLYTLRVVSPLVILVLGLSMPTFWFVDGGFRVVGFIALVCFIVIFIGSFPLERDAKRQYQRLAFKCPACHGYLVFLECRMDSLKTLETGCCYHCGKRVFDL